MLITLILTRLAEHIHVINTLFPIAPVWWLQTDLYFALFLVVVKLIGSVIHYAWCCESRFLNPLMIRNTVSVRFAELKSKGRYVSPQVFFDGKQYWSAAGEHKDLVTVVWFSPS